MNFKLLIITLALTSGFIGSVFAQQTTGDVSGAAILYEPDPKADADLIKQLKDKAVIIRTQEGSFMIELFPEDAPKHVEHFLKLVESNYYQGTIFHRIIPGFMIQGGDPNTKNPELDRSMWGQGRPDYNIDNEFNTINHVRGIVSMARGQNIDSAGSQFFIVHKDSPHLDGQYTAFGKLIPGTYSFDNLDRIAELDTDNRDAPIDTNIVKIIETQIVDPYQSPFGEPMKSDYIVRDIKTGGGTIQEYKNSKHDVQFTLPYRWSGTHIPTGDFAFLMEPTPMNHSVLKQIEISGFTPQVLVTADERNPRTPADIVILDSDIFSIKSASDPEIISNYLIENMMGTQGHLLTTLQTLETPEGTEQFKLLQIHFTNQETQYSVVYINTVEFFRYEVNAFTQVLRHFILPIDGELQRLDLTTNDGYRAVLDQSKVFEEQTVEEPIQLPTEIGGCLIATASYGSELAPQVQQLRELRDNTVLQTESGAIFMASFNQFYYSFSPAIADYERENTTFKEIVKLTLPPLLTSLTLLQYVDIDSESEMLGYGIAIILLNIGMYFIAPAVLITKIRSFYKLQ